MLHRLLGTSPAIVALRDELSRLLARPAGAARRLPPVLIQGETGTGKGLVAQIIHQAGPRADMAFVDVNCAAIPETLLEAELFGFERGAFTDARHAKAGLLQVAHRGTIFLDEIGLMPEGLQAKLLKALEDRTVRRLGSTRAEPADAWVLSATSEDLHAALGTRRFREDLYHRLAVMTLSLPPLRERGADVLLLARHYLDRACSEYGLPVKTLASEAEAAVMAYAWPGNVRELANVMERVALLTDIDQVSASALRLPAAGPRPSAPPRTGDGVNEQMAALERTRIEEALNAEAWNISRAATRLGLPRNTLRYRMERHGLIEGGDAVQPSRRRSDSSPPPSVRWTRSRVTMLHVRLDGPDVEPAGHETTRLLEEIGAKANTFGGRIVDIGDRSVNAAFGLDVSEDAARHAALAAFAIHRATEATSGQRGRVRVALHTDEMLVGRLEDRVELDADSRKASELALDGLLSCTPGEPFVASAATRPFLERHFALEAVSPDDTQAWRVKSLAEVQSRTEFVARAPEMAMLEQLLAQAEDRRGQAMLLAGDPGIGKTRLLREFRQRVHGRAGWLQGSALSIGRSLPFHPLIDLLRQAFSVGPTDSESVIADRIAAVTTPLGEAFRPSVPFLRSLLSSDPGEASLAQLDPKLRRAGIFEAIARFLHAASERRPLIVVLEDLQWMDPATGEFLATMLEGLADSRILVCATCRPGYALPLPTSAFGTQITLGRMSRAEASAIGRSILGGAVLSRDVEQLLADKTDGNPFFVEEVLRSLEERGLLERRGGEIGLADPTSTIDVPDTIQDVLLGRLGRLDAGPRDVIRVAAVIGREFSREVLERLMPDAQPALEERLRTLRAAELIQTSRIWPEVVYQFKHALTQEVAYHAQQQAARRALHGRIAEAIERGYADRLSEHSGVLAHHFTEAERWDKALEYLLLAAQQAEGTFATREALALYDEALRATERLTGTAGNSATLIRIHEAKARLHFVRSDFGLAVAEGERILPLARLMNDREKEADALATIAWASTWERNIDAAIRYAGESLAVAEPAGALAVQGRAHLTIGFVRGVTGSLDESRSALDKAMAISLAAGDLVHRSLSLSVAGLVRNWEGDYTGAERLQAEGLAIARDRGLFVPLLFSCFMRGLTLTGKGDYDEAFDLFTEGLTLAERVGDEAIHHRLLNCLGWLYADLGDLDRAAELNATSARIGRRRNDPGTQPNAELNLAEISSARGDLDRAQDQYDEVFRYFKNPSNSLWMRFRYSIRMFAGMGELAVARGDLALARRHNAECLQLAERTRSRKNLVKAWRLSGDIAWADRDLDAAEGHFRRSLDQAVLLGNPVQLWKAELALGRFLQDTGRLDEGRQALARARSLMQRVRDGLRRAELRDAFDRHPDAVKAGGLAAGD